MKTLESVCAHIGGGTEFMGALHCSAGWIFADGALQQRGRKRVRIEAEE